MNTRVIFFGMQGTFSLLPLQGLVKAGIDISAVVIPISTTDKPLPRRVEPLPPTPSDLPIITPYLSYNIVHVAWERHIPVWEVGSLSNAPTLALLADLQPDLIVVACFPYIFPPSLLQHPRYGCLNLHPSLLPAYRGPLPLFWLARQGERQAGVTLHYLDEGLDTGDIVAQTAFDWPDGISGTDLERRCAEEGAKLLLAAVQRLAQRGKLPRRPQPQEGNSYFSWPTEQDLVIPTHWAARRAFNFVRAVGLDWPLVIEVGQEQRFPVGRALGYEANQTLDQPYRFEHGELLIQFQPGVLRLQYYLSRIK